MCQSYLWCISVSCLICLFAQHHFLFSLLFSPFSHFTAGKKACSHSDPWGVTSPVKHRNDTCEKNCGTVMHSWDWSVKQRKQSISALLISQVETLLCCSFIRPNVTACRQNCLTRRVPPCWRDGCGLTAAEGCHISLYEAFSALMLEGGEGTAALSNARP